jgi:hypothetical protein
MATIHAWFSSESALRHGSMVYRKLDGSTVKVTRMNLQKDGNRPDREGETYVGEVVRTEDGGCVQPKPRAACIPD